MGHDPFITTESISNLLRQASFTSLQERVCIYPVECLLQMPLPQAFNIVTMTGLSAQKCHEQ